MVEIPMFMSNLQASHFNGGKTMSTTNGWEWFPHTTYTNGDDWGMVNMALFDHVYPRWIWNLQCQGMNAPPANGCQMPGGPAEKGCLCRMIGICSDDIHIFHQMIS